MPRLNVHLFLFLLLFFALFVPLCGCSSPKARQEVNVLVFTRTQGFRHDSIPAGVNAMRSLCDEAKFTMEHTEDPNVFTDDALARFNVITFLNTTGDVLNDAQQRAFEAWLKADGSTRGFVGVHSAADTEYDWPFYQAMLGGHFTGHPPVQSAVVVRDDAAHPATHMLPERWRRVDEWYNYSRNPGEHGSHVLLSLDTTSYEGSTMAGEHPIAWCSEHKGRRVFYTGGGHTIESFAEPLFRQHLLGGLRWAAHQRN